ncbi:hypothetical protein CULC0102_0556 [Corynebacterium ulcerans 0102]|nr:hypothetical protein CULC0102_0556 [Corynebacterium ulcerans 0102]
MFFGENRNVAPVGDAGEPLHGTAGVQFIKLGSFFAEGVIVAEVIGDLLQSPDWEADDLTVMPEGGAVLLEAGKGFQGLRLGAEPVAVEAAAAGWEVSVPIGDVVVLVTVGHFLAFLVFLFAYML